MRRLFILAGIASLFTWSCSVKNSTVHQVSADQKPQQTKVAEEAVYNNPVLAGDYADPSVVRVGDEYWATATSSEWAPLFPLLHSKDLVNWKTVGHVFPNNLPEWAEANFWAPEISYDNGKFYIYYTARKKGGSLCVGVASATKATGPYTDHGPLICQDAGAIDGYPIRDEKGDLYLVWKEDGNSRKLPTPLWAQRMNEERSALLGEKFELFRNDADTWEGGLVEGPAIIRRNGYFYTFYAGDKCCGRACTYGVGVARAKKLAGPWEKFAGNPIMQQNDSWKCAGHGSIVTDTQGRDFFLYHAYATDDFVYPGRQGMLDEVLWGDDGWPYFKSDGPSVSASAPYAEQAAASLDVYDEFKDATLAPSWQWSVTQAATYTLKPQNNGQIALKATPDKIGSILGQRTKSGNYTATLSLDKALLPKGTLAGLTAFGDPFNSIGIAVQDKEIVLWQVKRKVASELERIPVSEAQTLHFKLTVQDGHKLNFAWSPDGSTWTEANKGEPVDGAFLPPWDRGVRVGLSAKGPETASATFNWFKLNYNKKDI